MPTAQNHINMKRTIIFLLAAAATEAGASVQNAVLPTLPTSAKLTELQTLLSTQGESLKTLPVMSKEWNDAMLEIYKTNKLIDAEIAGIKRAENEAKIAELRNNRIAFVTNYKAAVIADFLVQNDKKADEAAKLASGENLLKLEEGLKTELLKTVPGSTPAKTAAAGDKPAGEKGATAKRIRGYFDEIRAGNPSATQTEIVKDIIARGESRGTTGAVVLAYMQELGEK